MIDTGSDWNAAGIQHLSVLRLRKTDLLPPTEEMCQTRTASNGELEWAGYINAQLSWNVQFTSVRLVFFRSFTSVFLSLNTLIQ